MKDRQRYIRNAQIKLREMNFGFDGNDPVGIIDATGFDRYGVTIEKISTGVFEITYEEEFGRDDAQIDVQGRTLPTSVALNPTLNLKKSIRIELRNISGVVHNTDVFVRIVGSEFDYDI